MIIDETFIDLGLIGHKAKKLQSLFNDYPTETNEESNYLRFEDYNKLDGSKGVLVRSNCFTESELKEQLLNKLLLNL